MGDAHRLLCNAEDEVSSRGTALQLCEADLQSCRMEIEDLKTQLEVSSSQLQTAEDAVLNLQVTTPVLSRETHKSTIGVK